MLLQIAWKELREISRDPYTVGVLGVFVAILSLNCTACNLTWFQQFQKQSTLQKSARQEWLTQETESAHQATHHGTTLYKKPSPFSAFDPGVDPEFGTVVYLESHRRHAATDATHQDQVSLLQLDMTTPALLMQVILPLVVIVLSHSLVSRERELGTWRLLASFGTSHQRLVMGKLTVVLILTLLLSAPALIALLYAIMQGSIESGILSSEILMRGVALYAVNVLYLAGWCAAGTALSSRCSSGVSLIILLTCWAGWTLVIPRLAVDLAYSRFPLPSEQSLLEKRETAIRQGSDGRVSLEEFNTNLEKQLLQKYEVTDLQDLPINLDAARLLAMEEFTDAIDDHAQSQLAEIYQKQNRFMDWYECVSPYLAIRSLSSSFAGTDRHHHHVFLDSTEEYRRMLVKTMNTAEMKGEGPGDTPESARTFWSKVPEFRQSLPAMTTVFNAMRRPIGSLIAWFVLMMILALLPAKRTLA